MDSKYLAYDPSNGDYEGFETLEKAREWLKDCLTFDGEICEEAEQGAIYELKEKVVLESLDKKSNYEYENEEDIPDDDTESEAWPYSNEHDEVFDVKILPVNKEEQ
jgi:hypothetical protein